MTPARQGAPGSTRICPHCRQTILESALVCPACRHHLRFATGEEARAPATFTPLRIEGSIRHPPAVGSWEYSIVVVVHDDRGTELSRHVAAVGSLGALEGRSFAITVEVFTPTD